MAEAAVTEQQSEPFGVRIGPDGIVVAGSHVGDPVNTAEALDTLLAYAFDETGLPALDDARKMLHPVILALEAAQASVADYENRITWHTTCGQCATVLDRSINEYERRERAETALTAVRELAEKWSGEPTTIERYLANEILKLVAPFKETGPNLNSGGLHSSLLESGVVHRSTLGAPEPPGYFAKCVRCTDPVLVHDDGSTDGGVDTVKGILCDGCVADENEREAGDE